MRQVFKGEQITQTITTIGHHTAFNNDQTQYHMISYKRPRNDKCKTMQTTKKAYLFIK